MSKYQPLWEHLQGLPGMTAQLSFEEVAHITGFPFDHAFLTFKKELPAYGWAHEKISLKKEWVKFKRVPVPLETEHLVLRPFTEADAADVFAACSNPVLGQMAGWPPHETVEDSLAYIRDIVPQGLVWAITEQGEEAPVIGSIGLLPDPRFPKKKDVLLLGYWLHKDYWNRGYMTEAAQALLAWAREHCAPRLFTTSHFLENHGSRRVIEKCGFAAVGEGVWDDDPRPVMWYEM